MTNNSQKNSAAITISDGLGISGTKIMLDQKASVIRRIFWVLLVLSMFGVLIYQVTDRVKTFLSNPMAVNIKMYPENSVRFPVILICNMNPSTISTTYGYSKDINYLKLMHDYLSALSAITDDQLNETLNTLKEAYGPYVDTALSPHETFNYVVTTGHKLENMLKYCNFQNEPCSQNDFQTIVNNQTSRICFAFNANQSFYTAIPGYGGGLKLWIDIQQYEYMLSFRGGAGIEIAVVDNIHETDSINEMALQVSAGTSASLGITRMNYSDVKPPVGTCNGTHGIPHCLLDCRSRYIIDKCHCRLEWMTGHAPSCTIFDQILCVDPKLIRLASATNDGSINCNCRPKCTRSEYSVTLSSSHLSSFTLNQFLLNLQPNVDVEKICRIQDWTQILRRNSSITYELEDLGRFADPSDNSTLHGIFQNLSDQLDSLESSLINTNESKNLSRFADYLKEKHFNLIEITKKSFFYEYLYEENRNSNTQSANIADDFSVRSANDILRQNGSHMKLFYDQVDRTIDGIMILIQNHQNGSSLTIFNKINSVSSTIGSVLENYGLLRNIFAKVYVRYMNIYHIVQNDTALLNTYDCGKFQTEEFYKRNYLELNVFFESLSTTKVSQFETDSLTSLICDLGGSIGLWLGGSILTLFEIFDLTAVILTAYIKKWGRAERKRAQ